MILIGGATQPPTEQLALSASGSSHYVAYHFDGIPSDVCFIMRTKLPISFSAELFSLNL